MTLLEPSPLERPPAQGTGHLTFTRTANLHTAITTASAHSPLRLLTPRPNSHAAYAYTSTFGGGLVSGDHISLHLHCHPHTTAYVSTQASTKVYRSTNNQLTQQSLHAQIDNDALLILTPDPVTCFANSRYHQSQHFTIAPRASLLLLDAFTSGRHARNERWHHHSLQFTNIITLNNKRLLTDTLRLDPTADTTFTTAEFNHYATLAMIGPRLTPHAQHLLQTISTMPIAPHSPLLITASPLADGLLLRLAAQNTDLAHHFLLTHTPFLQHLLGEHPWHRKW